MNENDLTIYVDSWDDRTLIVSFSNVIHFMYSGGFQITQLYEIIDQTILEEKLQDSKDINLNEKKFRLFCIENLYHFPFIEVVSNDVNIIKDQKLIIK